MDDNLFSEASSEFLQFEEERSPESDLFIEDSQSIQPVELLKHPVFTIEEDDEILKIAIQSIWSLLQGSLCILPDFSQFEDKIFSFVFQDQEIIEYLRNQEILEKSVCGKYFTTGDVYVQCLDCGIDSQYSVPSLCTSCFDRANHENHRLIFIKKEDTSSGTCDCGDTAYIKPEGFCPEHSQEKIDFQTQLQRFPQDIVDRYQAVVKRMFYVVFSVMELSQYPSSVRSQLSKIGTQLLNKILNFCQTCQNDINEAFILIFVKVLQEQLAENYNLLLHDCEDISQSELPSNFQIKEQNCRCTILGNLFRIGNIISKEQQSQLEKMLVDSTKISHFKLFLAVEFTKFMDFLYDYNKTKYLLGSSSDQKTSMLLNISFQTYLLEEQIEAVYKSGYIKNITNIMKKFIYKAPKVDYSLYKMMNSLSVIIDYFQQPGRSISHQIIKESTIIPDLLETLRSFQLKFVYTGEIKLGTFEHLIDFKHLTYSLTVEKMLYNPLETILGVTLEMTEEDRRYVLKEFATHWLKEFKLIKEVLKDENNKMTFSCGMERVFSCFLQVIAQKNSVLLLLQEMLPQFTQEEVIAEVLRSLGIMRLFQTMDGMSANQLKFYYYLIGLSFFEIDIMLIQQTIRVIEPEKLMNILTMNFFSYSSEIQSFFEEEPILKTNPPSRQSLQVIEDFLNFLVFIMTDELCSLNFELSLNKCYGKNLTPTSSEKQSLENIVINVLLGSYWTTLPKLKKEFEPMLTSTDSLDEIVSKVTIVDEKTLKIRVKDHYLKDIGDVLDLYMFYKDPIKKQEIMNGITSKNKMVDLISGKFNSNPPSNLWEIQIKIFESSLPRILSLMVQKLPMISIIRPALRLVLFNFQVVKLGLLRNDLKAPALLKKLEENYFTVEFEDNLKKLLVDQKDCKQCIEKIFACKSDIMKFTTSTEIISEGETEIRQSKEDDDEKKKNNQMTERMNRIKEEFMKKQAKFAEKNINAIEEEVTVNNPELVCQHCLEGIQVQVQEGGADYGIPIYISFTNNLNSAVFSWWPLISSCNHYYHKDCFNKLLNNPKSFQKVLYSKDEAYCTLCKTLCNFFLQINNLATLNSFATNIKSTFENYLFSRLKNSSFKLEAPDNDEKLTIEILKRAHHYYVTSGYETNLYGLFFKNALGSIIASQESNNESLFYQLASRNNSAQDPIFSKLNGLLFETMSCKESKNYLEEDPLHQKYLLIIKDILLFKAIEYFTDAKAHKDANIEDLYHFYLENQSNFLKILDLKMIFSSFSLMKNILKNSPVEFENSIEKEEEDLFQRFGFKINFQDLIKLAISEIPNRPSNEKLLITQLLKGQVDLKPIDKMNQAPLTVSLPSTYAEFNSKFFRQKCTLCNGYSSHLNSCICLICGVVVCEKSCDALGQKSGNLNSHCKEYHLGTGLFLDKHHLRFVLINSPLNIRFSGKDIYTDNLGQSISKVLDDSVDLSKIDFKKFKLNKKLAEEIKKVITNCEIEKEFFRIIVSEKENKIRDGLL